MLLMKKIIDKTLDEAICSIINLLKKQIHNLESVLYKNTIDAIMKLHEFFERFVAINYFLWIL